MNGMKCRTCYSELHADGGIINLNSKDSSSNMKVWAKLQLCVPEIELTRTNEEYVCNNCSLQLKSAYNFRTMCLKTEAKFQELYSTIQDELPQSIHNSPREVHLKNTQEVLINHSPRKNCQLTDEDLIAKACTEISELQEKENSLNCSVSVAALPETVIKVTGQKNSVYICSYCRSIFLCQKNFLVHVTKHFENSGTAKEHCNLRCDKCDIAFRSLNIYELHLKFMHPEQYGTYVLRDNVEELLDIKTEVMYEEEPSVNKKIETNMKPCVKKSTKLLKVKTSTLFKREKINPKKCSICFKMFSNYGSLLKHLKVHKRSTTMCSACRRNFVDIDSHKTRCKHILKSKELKDRPNNFYKCPFCEKGFTEKRSFLGHLSIHGKIKLRKCKKCNIQFDSLSTFAFHLLTYGCPYHQSATPKLRREKSRIVCPICSQKQKTKSHLATHIAKHPNKTIPCTSCETRFRNIPTYMSHITACKRRKRTELVIIKQEQKDNEEQKVNEEQQDNEEQLNLEVEGILQKATNYSTDLPDMLELVTESQLLDPLKISDDLENAPIEPTEEVDKNDDLEINLQLTSENRKKQTDTENFTTEVIVQQINKNIKSIIEKMNSNESQMENLSKTKKIILLETADIPNSIALPTENLNRDSVHSAVVSSSSNESSSIIEENALIPSTSTMLTV